MIRLIFTFILTFALVFLTIIAFHKMSVKERFQFTKILVYGIIISAITIAILSLIVFLF